MINLDLDIILIIGLVTLNIVLAMLTWLNEFLSKRIKESDKKLDSFIRENRKLNKLLLKSKNVPNEYIEAVNEHFWDLI